MFVNVLACEENLRQRLFNADEISNITYDGKTTVTIKMKPNTGNHKKESIGFHYTTVEVAQEVYNGIVQQITK